ncbi:MAG: Gfo/Idh/MocA family oxidoreductase [Candidatus Margulisiibacteriota bacterium]
MKYVIAGLGSIGRRHLKNLVVLGESDIVLLRNNLSSLPAEELQQYPVVTSIEAALALNPDAFIISNPSALHLDVAIPAAKAGCHILLEKPISNSLEKIDKLQAALLQGQGKLLVGFQFRFHPTLKIASQLILNGEIGRPVSICARWGEYLPDMHPWEDYKSSYAARPDLGGGVVLTLCHPFDYLNWLLGKPTVEWACAENRGDLGIAVEDTAEAILRFPNGALGVLQLNYLQKPPTHTLEIVGTEGTIGWNNTDGKLSIYRNKLLNWEHFSPSHEFERNSLFVEEMRHFISIVNGKELPLCSLEDGINALSLALKVLAFKTK